MGGIGFVVGYGTVLVCWVGYRGCIIRMKNEVFRLVDEMILGIKYFILFLLNVIFWVF